MAVVFIALGIFAAYVSHGTSLWIPALVVAVAAFLGNGVLLNYGRRDEPDDAPNWAAVVSFAAVLGSLALVAIHFIA